jgi:hypothetical protein
MRSLTYSTLTARDVPASGTHTQHAAFVARWHENELHAATLPHLGMPDRGGGNIPPTLAILKTGCRSPKGAPG